MADPRISVLIPTYNRAHTIRQCLESAICASYQELEIVVSDNGSSDGTADVVAEYARHDARIRLICHRENLGPLPNWRSCLEAATGELVHWLWSDDWVDREFYGELVRGMASVDASMALSPARLVCRAEGWTQIVYSVPSGCRNGAQLIQRYPQGMKLPCSPACALLPMAIVRRHFVDDIPRVGDVDCTRRAIGCDALMILGSLLAADRVYCHSDPLVYLNVHSGSISVNAAPGVLDVHYAWARLWWSRRNGVPCRWFKLDLIRLLWWCRWRCLIRFLWSFVVGGRK